MKGWRSRVFSVWRAAFQKVEVLRKSTNNQRSREAKAIEPEVLAPEATPLAASNTMRTNLTQANLAKSEHADSIEPMATSRAMRQSVSPTDASHKDVSMDAPDEDDLDLAAYGAGSKAARRESEAATDDGLWGGDGGEILALTAVEDEARQGDGTARAGAIVLEQKRTQALSPISESRGVSTTDPLRRYMTEIMRHPLLSREEEFELAVRYRKTGDVDAAYRLVTGNLRLVVKLAHEYRRSTMSLLDLIQEGNVGLMRAVQKFDPYRGVKLSSYAAFWIRAYILRYVMENFRLVKVGTTQAQRKLFFNLRKEREKLIEQGFDPTAKLLAKRLDVTEEDVTEMELRMSAGEMSLDAPLSDEDATPRSERLTWQAPSVDETLGDLQLQEILRQKLSEFGATLQGREKEIFEKRLVAEEPQTLQALGESFGLTRERTRQLEAKLIKNFKAWIQEEVPDFRDLEVGADR